MPLTRKRWFRVGLPLPLQPHPPIPLKAPNHPEKLCWDPAKPGMSPHPQLRCWGTAGRVRPQGLGGGTYSSVTSFGMPLGRARSPLLLHRTTVSTQVHCSGQRGLSWQLLSSLPAENPHGMSLVEDEPGEQLGKAG